jgi:hypothetical protein
VGSKKSTTWVAKMTTANRQENEKSCPTAPFCLASLPCPLLLLQPPFRRGIAVWWRAMLSLHKAAMQRQPVLLRILLSASRHRRPPICSTNPRHRISASNSTVTAPYAHFLASHSGPLSGFNFRTHVCGDPPARRNFLRSLGHPRVLQIRVP